MIRQVKGLRIGDVFECDIYEQLKDIEFIVKSFPNRGTVYAKEKNGKKTIKLSIKSIKSEFLK